MIGIYHQTKQPLTQFTMGKFTFNRIIPTSMGRKWDWNEKNEQEFVRFGDDNLFPNHIITLYNRSSIHAAAVNAIVQGIVGNGLTANEHSYLERANSKGETWNDIFAKAAYDYKLHGSYALEIIYSKDRTKIADVYHIDFSYIRAKEKDNRGHIPGYYISSQWDKKARYSAVTDEDVDYLPIFNWNLRHEHPSQIFIHKGYRPGQEYYPLPDYMGALKVIELDAEVDTFHTNNIKNGLAPSLAITTFTNGSDDEKAAIEASLRANYGGPENAGGLMYMDVDSKENAPVITAIQPNNTDTYYTDINDLVVQKILTGHRITSPMILGIKTEGQLGGRTEMIDAMLLFQHNVIEPFQQKLLADFESLLKFNHEDVILGVENTYLFEDGETEEEVITDVNTTEEEQQEVDTQETIDI